MWREKNIYFTEHDIYFTKLMFILKNINLELKLALRTKYIFYQSLLYMCSLTTILSLYLFAKKNIVCHFYTSRLSIWPSSPILKRTVEDGDVD